MSDPDLRRQRRSSELPLAEQVALLNAQRRAGEVSESHLLLAAYAGELAAQASLALPKRAEAESARLDHTRAILAVRWVAVREQAPKGDRFVKAASEDEVLSRLCPRWQGALVLAANVPEVTGFLLQARSGGALGVTRGREQTAPASVSEASVSEALTAARAQIEAEGLRFVAEDEALQRELLELEDWRAPRTVEVWVAGFEFWGREVEVRARLARALACMEGLAPSSAARATVLAACQAAARWALSPGDETREAAAAARIQGELASLVEEGGQVHGWQLAARLSSAALSVAAGLPPPPEEGTDELALLSERGAITADLSAWALGGMDPLEALVEA
ncbi:MAG: hypothetical protein JKY65_12150 [Planctomycetes bacterium]|nr:hypothetical protein [Planctomycetota bacterium]